ncbi:MAG: hypothetical protein WDZ41_03880 [Candidatus Babeliales bacterium]
MKYILNLYLLCILPLYATEIHISIHEIHTIGSKIWHNECNGTIEGLTNWNEGEEFASLGIGHFTWYPQGTAAIFKETFPKLLFYFEQNKKIIPDWLSKVQKTGCPWPDRTSFMNAQKSAQMIELRTLLTETIDLQAKFIIERLGKIIDSIENKIPSTTKTHIKKQFLRVAQSPNGLYALIDYVNFKGEGLNPKEAYNNQGWGLIQVLEEMKGTKEGKAAITEFTKSAKKILARRIQNSPPTRNEKRWLLGWYNRLNTYLHINA